MIRLRRSLLFMPGSNARALEKARILPADGIILDLEDSVAPDAKAVARLSVSWPTSGTTQTFENIASDQSLEITEGASAYKVLQQPPLPAPKSKANQAGLSLR